jgi:NitT/TauT family transport system substrate-binding protein
MRIGLALAAMLGAGGPHATQAQTLEPIKVSYQPALYWALPYYVATEKKFWAEAGLAPEFSTFPAGARRWQPAQSWDVGAPARSRLCSARPASGLSIGITNDESR